MPLKKLGSKLLSVFTRSKLDESFYEDLEDILIEGDLGASAAMEVSDQLKEYIKTKPSADNESALAEVKSLISNMVRTDSLEISADQLTIILVLGVNGVGKTTNIAKLAKLYKDQGKKVVLAAGDTFRAAAIDQLKIHGDRLGIRVVAQQPGSDAGAVIFDAIESARNRGEDIVIADTAGRMHNKENLVRELQKITKIVNNRAPDAAFKKILVIDATTGQNGLRQAETFNAAVDIDGIILTKFDSSGKGGIAVTVSKQLNIPFLYLGNGEGYDHLEEFNVEKYTDALLEH